MQQNHYEVIFVITPVLSEQQMTEVSEKFKTTLLQAGADVYHEENWGLKKLAYPIEKKTTGFYQLVQFSASPDTIAPFEVELRRDERILRFLTTAQDKYAVDYNERRRKGLVGKNKKNGQEQKQEG